MSDITASKGMFISDAAREKIGIKLSEEQFNELKKAVQSDTDPNRKEKCFLTDQYYPVSEGLFLTKPWIANAIQKSMDSADKLYNEYKDGTLTCTRCSTKINHKNERKIECPKCKSLIDTKEYIKKVKIPFVRRMALSLWIKSLRK